MSLRIGDVIGGALNNVFTEHAWKLSLVGMVFFLLVHLSLAATPGVEATTNITDFISNPSSIAVIAGLFAFFIIYAIGTLRTLHSRECRLEHFTGRLGITALHTVIGGLVVAIAIAAGAALFVIPGIILLVSLYLWSAHVIIDDETFLEAFKETWQETQGNRWFILCVILLAYLISFGITVLLQATVGFLLLLSSPSLLFTLTLIAYYVQVYLGLFEAAVLVETYEQLTT